MIEPGAKVALGDVRPMRRGQDGVDLRHRVLGAGIRASWHSGEHGFAGLDPGGRERVEPLPPRNPGYFEDCVRHGFPMGRLGTAEEVADVIVFIALPPAHWINCRNIPVDGLEQPHAPLDRRPY
jgi:NAD(P)-dependent dehydrogenase (short-subunit alcohol dehydrogenase family)